MPQKATFIIIPIVGGLVALGLYFMLPRLTSQNYREASANVLASQEIAPSEPPATVAPTPFVATHIKTPEPVKALYLTSWAAGTPSLRDHVVSLINTTEANSVVIDIKDYTGRVSYDVTDPKLVALGSEQRRIPDIRQLIADLHAKNIYVIGRIAVFQDPYLITKYPEDAVKKLSDKNTVWKDNRGISWLDAGSQQTWDYVVALGKDAYSQGFDEINYDYIRYPSDGNLKDIYYPLSDGKERHEVLLSFFQYLHTAFANTGIVTSADLFGLTTSAKDDMGIGQILEDALPNFDYIAPMVYPSHFAPGWNGYKNPAAYPYEVISYSMKSAVDRAKAIGVDPNKLRPWLQDFDLGAIYTKDMVRKEIQATYDSGLTSWMLWDAANRYTPEALLPQ